MPFIELDLIFRYTLGEEKPLSCNGGILNRKYRLGTSQHILGIREGKSLAPSRHRSCILLAVVGRHFSLSTYRLCLPLELSGLLSHSLLTLKPLPSWIFSTLQSEIFYSFKKGAFKWKWKYNIYRNWRRK